MAANTSTLRPVVPNRRRSVRHKIQTPAYAVFKTESDAPLLDLHEIVDISEDGVAIHCISPLEPGQRVNLSLDLAESDQPIFTSGRVVWTNATGRAGLRFSDLPSTSLFRLREWLFLNAMAGVANAEAAGVPMERVAPRPDYTETLAAVTAVQREVEALGADLAAALQLVADRAQTLVRATGAAIALATSDPDFMDCRASAGDAAPPVGVRLQVGSGFSGECVKSGRLLRCDDTEMDPRVDAAACRALGIRSILAAPVRVGEKSIGILEAFSGEANSFSDADTKSLQRLAETVLAAVNRAARAEDLPTLKAEAPAERFAPQPGSVLFASADEPKKDDDTQPKSSDGINLPRRHLILLVCAAAAISTALGILSAPWIQARLEQRSQSQPSTVLASSQPPAPATHVPAVEGATMDQLREMAQKGNPAAENALGLRYFQGDDKAGIRQDEKEAFRWFSSAAEHGDAKAQSKLGFLYWSGRGTTKDLNKAYFWTVLARARGDEGNRELASLLASGMTRAQTAAIEEEASNWLHRQTAAAKPDAGR